MLVATKRVRTPKSLSSCASVHGCDFLQSWDGRLVCICGFQQTSGKRDAIVYNVCLSTTKPKLNNGPKSSEIYQNRRDPLHQLSIVPCEPLFQIVFDQLFPKDNKTWPEETVKLMRKITITRGKSHDAKI